MTIQLYDTFKPRLARMNATSKLVKAWESKNAKRALKGGGVSLMALSLAACGDDDSALDASMADLAAAVASLSAAEAVTTAAKSEAAAAVASQAAAEADTAAAEAAQAAAEADTAAAETAQAEAETAQTEAETAQAEAEAAQTESETAQAEAEAAQETAEVDAAAAVDAQATAEGLQAVAEAAQAVAVADAAAAQAAQAEAEAAQAAAEADTAAAEADTAAAEAATVEAKAAQAKAEAATVEAEAATVEAEAARDNLQAQVDAFLAANTDLAGRTLDVDGETITAGDATDFDIIVAGLTGGDDDMTATVTGTGTGELSFTFVDADDSVTLTASDLSSYSSVAITAGTLDLSAVTLGAGVDITINSGVVMTAAQFLAADSIETDGDGEITVAVSSVVEALAVEEAAGLMTGVSGANFNLLNAEGSTATDAEIDTVEVRIDLDLTVTAASIDPVGLITAAVDDIETESGLVDAANIALGAASDAAALAEAQATLNLVNNKSVVTAIDDAGVIAEIAAEIDDTDTDAMADVATVFGPGPGLSIGEVLDNGLTTALGDATNTLEGLTGLNLNAVSPAIYAATISDRRDAEVDDISNAQGILGDATGALDGTLVIARGEAADAAATVRDDAIVKETALVADATGAATIAEAIINIDDLAAGATLDRAGALDVNGGAPSGDVALFAEVEGVVSLTDAVTADGDDYDIAYTAADNTAKVLTVTGSFIDDLLVAQQAAVDASAAVADADTALGEANVVFGAAVTAAADNADLGFIAAAAVTANALVLAEAAETNAIAAAINDVNNVLADITQEDATFDRTGALDVNGAATNGDVALFELTNGVVSLDLTVISATTGTPVPATYDITYTDAGGDQVVQVITASFIDDLLVAQQEALDATATRVEVGNAVVDAEGAVNAVYADYRTAEQGLETANTSSADLETAIANYETLVALDGGITDLEVVAADALALVAGADETDFDAAVAALENTLVNETPGLNVNYDNGDTTGNDYNYASEIAINVQGGNFEVDTTAGLDIIDFGAGTVFTVVPTDIDVVTGAAGDANVIEVLLQQLSDELGVDEAVSVTIEVAAADGSSSVTSGSDFTITNVDGDLSLADLDFTSVDGLMFTGAYDTGLIV